MHTDPIADMLTRIRNANKAMHDIGDDADLSSIKEEIARLLKEEGYITRLPRRRTARASTRSRSTSSSAGTASASSPT